MTLRRQEGTVSFHYQPIFRDALDNITQMKRRRVTNICTKSNKKAHIQILPSRFKPPIKAVNHPPGLPIPALVQTITFFWLAAIVLVFAELTWLGIRLRKGIAERFGDNAGKGNVMYGVIRATQMRRLRLPKPAVKPGQPPRP